MEVVENALQKKILFYKKRQFYKMIQYPYMLDLICFLFYIVNLLFQALLPDSVQFPWALHGTQTWPLQTKSLKNPSLHTPVP